MNNEQISVKQFELLRSANNLNPGDIVYWHSGSPPAIQFQVAAEPGPDGDVAVRDNKGNLRLARINHLKLAPLFWLEGKPVYKKDGVYYATPKEYGGFVVHGYEDGMLVNFMGKRYPLAQCSPQEVRWLDGQLLREGDRVYQKGIPGELTVEGFRGDLVDTLHISSIHINSLTRTKPEPEVLVEGQPVVVGETLFHKHSEVKGVVVAWGDSAIQLKTRRGVIGFLPQVLTRTDPSILFEVEGKPVRKGDKLYSKFNRGYSLAESERVISGVGLSEGFYAVSDGGGNRGPIEFLTWEPPLFTVEGQLVFKGDKLFSTHPHHYGGERTIIGVNEHGVYSTPGCPTKGHTSELTWETPALVKINGVCVRSGDSVWRRDTGDLWEAVSFNQRYETLFCKNTQGGHTSFKADQVSSKPPLFHLKGKAIFAGDKVWTVGGDEVGVLYMDQHGVVITTPDEWCGCVRFDVEWLSATPIARLLVDGVRVRRGDKLFDKTTGNAVYAYRQVGDKIEGGSGGSWTADMLTRTDPAQELVEVPIWVNCYDDGTIGPARLYYGNYLLVGSLLHEAEGTFKVPKHIADKLKR